MVLDTLQNCERYYAMHPLFRQAFEYILSTDWNQVPLGKIVLQGDDLYINYMEVEGKIPEAAQYESHQAYIDIQVPLTSAETMGFVPTCQLTQPEAPYSPERDVTMYLDKGGAQLLLQPHHFAIFWPSDGHQPCIGSGSWRKIVVKIKL